MDQSVVDALHKDPQTLCIELCDGDEEVMADLDVVETGLVQLEAVAAEHHAEDEVQLCPGEVDAQTAAGAAAKGDEVAVEGLAVRGEGVVEPALGDVGVAVWEDVLIVRDVRDGHADVCVCGDEPVLVLQRRGAAGAGVAGAEAVGQAHGFGDAGLEVGHLLQRVELEGGAVGEGGDEVGVQAGVDARRVDDVERGDAEGKGGGFHAAADDDLGFFAEALLRLVLGGQFGGEDFLEDCFLCVVCLEGFAGHGAADVGPLVALEFENVLCCGLEPFGDGVWDGVHHLGAC